MENKILRFECIGIKNNGKFPVENTWRGRDLSPEFQFYNLLGNAKTLAITLEDLSHPIKNFTHWVIWNIPAASHIAGAIPAGQTVPSLGNAKQGIAYGLHRYAGPKPPKGKKHSYCFTIYVLDCELDLQANTVKKEFLKRAEGHILQKGSLTAEFESSKSGGKRDRSIAKRDNP